MNLAAMAATASFTKLQIVTSGEAKAFQRPAGEYAFDVRGDVFQDAAGQRFAKRYSKNHSEVAGTILDERAA